MTEKRISRGQLLAVRSGLSDRDSAILTSLVADRFLTSAQIRRMHFADHASTAAAIRASNRALARLSGLRLIGHLKRRVGGVRAGSGSNVWNLTEAGARLLTSTGRCDALPKRLRTREPTLTFLEHTLAVAEVCLRLSEAARGGNFAVVELLREPDCWRAYSGRHGGVSTLKPDLALVTASGDYEDHWFIEIDRDTEPPSRVIRACLRYEDYRRTGAEQKRAGVFPAIVWVVPDFRRGTALARHIARAAGLSKGLFAVVAVDDLPELIKAGIGSEETGHGA